MNAYGYYSYDRFYDAMRKVSYGLSLQAGQGIYARSEAVRENKTVYLKHMRQLAPLRQSNPVPADWFIDNKRIYYSSMYKEELDAYVYFRTCILNRTPMEPAGVSVPFYMQRILIDELANLVHSKNPQDNLDTLMYLWNTCATVDPEMQLYYFDMATDFAHAYHLTLPPLPDIAYSSLAKFFKRKLDVKIQLEWTFFQAAQEKQLHLAFGAIHILTGRDNVMNRKVWKQGYGGEIKEATRQAVRIVDAWLKKQGKPGLMEDDLLVNHGYYQDEFFVMAQYGRMEPMVRKRKLGRDDFTSPSYLENYNIQQRFISILRSVEMIVGQKHNIKTTLKAPVNLGPEILSILNTIVNQKPDSAGKEKSNTKELKLDFSAIDSLRQESEHVRQSLEVSEEVQEQAEDMETLAAFLSAFPVSRLLFLKELQKNSFKITKDIQAGLLDEVQSAFKLEYGMPLFRYKKIQPRFQALREALDTIAVEVPKEKAIEGDNPLEAFVSSLPDYQQQALRAVYQQDTALLETIAMEQMSMAELLVDEINQEAMHQLGQILIDPDLVIAQEYQDACRRLFG